MTVRLLLGICALVWISCGDKKEEGVARAPQTKEELIQAYRDIKGNFTAADSSLLRKTDTLRLPLALLSQLVPDSALNKYTGNDKNVRIRPVGKIDKEQELYLLTSFVRKGAVQLAAFVLDDKQQFLGHLPLLNTATRDGYVHSVSVNREPTFTLSKERVDRSNVAWYSRSSFAFNKDAKGFVNVMSDSNEKPGNGVSTVINPIDTFPRLNKFSGDYVRDRNNTLSLRDGRNASHYLFFIHFEKNNGECIGELKGELMVNEQNKAVYTENGDPCVIDFTFSNNRVKVKEQGTCGNHRGIKCFFDDTYTRKKEARSKKEGQGKK